MGEVRAVALDHEESGDPAAAIQSYSEMIEADPGAVDAYLTRGQIYHTTGDFEAAESDFNTVLRHEPRRSAAYFSRGRSQQAQGKHHQALVSYSLAISIEPQQAKWYYLRGKAYESLANESETNNEPARARELLQRAEKNFAIARQLDPVSNFGALEDSDS